MKARGGFAIERRDGLFSAFDRPPQGVIGKVSRVEKFVQKLVRSVLDHLHFFDDHFLLALQIVRVKARIGDQIGQQVESLRQRGIDDFQGKPSDFMGRVGVQMPAQPI